MSVLHVARERYFVFSTVTGVGSAGYALVPMLLPRQHFSTKSQTRLSSSKLFPRTGVKVLKVPTDRVSLERFTDDSQAAAFTGAGVSVMAVHRHTGS